MLVTTGFRVYQEPSIVTVHGADIAGSSEGAG
jgi:hypothetical protein